MFPSQDKIDLVCARLAENNDRIVGSASRGSAEETIELIRHMQKCMNELMEVSPTFTELHALVEAQVGKPVEIEIPDAEGHPVPYSLVPVGSKPYMEVLRILIGWRAKAKKA